MNDGQYFERSVEVVPTDDNLFIVAEVVDGTKKLILFPKGTANSFKTIKDAEYFGNLRLAKQLFVIYTSTNGNREYLTNSQELWKRSMSVLNRDYPLEDYFKWMEA